MEIKTTGGISSEFIKTRDNLSDKYLNNPETIKLIVDKKWIAIESIPKEKLDVLLGVRE